MPLPQAMLSVNRLSVPQSAGGVGYNLNKYPQEDSNMPSHVFSLYKDISLAFLNYQAHPSQFYFHHYRKLQVYFRLPRCQRTLKFYFLL